MDRNNFKTDIDLSYLREVVSGNTEFMIEMIDIFLDQTPGFVDDLTKAIEEKDWPKVALVAHKLKPTFSFMGIASANELMEDIERDARDQTNLDEVVNRFHLMQDVLQTIFDNLQQKKQELLKEG